MTTTDDGSLALKSRREAQNVYSLFVGVYVWQPKPKPDLSPDAGVSALVARRY